MSKQYLTISVLPENLYVPGAPVLITAGTLSRDRTTGDLVAQLTFRSLSEKPLHAATILVQQRSSTGTPLGRPLLYRYPNLSVMRNEEFGQNIPLLLDNPQTQSIAVSVEDVLFADYSGWQSRGEPWEPLRPALRLENVSDDAELLKQYQLTFGPRCAYIYREEKDLWYCCCGTLNHSQEEACHLCGTAADTLKHLDWPALRRKKEERLAAQKREAEEKAARERARREEVARLAALKREAEEKAALEKAQREAEEKAAQEKARQEEQARLAAQKREAAEKAAQERARQEEERIAAQQRKKEEKAARKQAKKQKEPKKQKWLIPVLAALLVCAAFAARSAFVVPDEPEASQQTATVETVNQESTYAQACALRDTKEYVQAAELFDELTDYKDSPAQSQECRYLYAVELMEQQKYEDAAVCFRELGTYQDSQALYKQALYSQATALADSGNFAEAYPLFVELETYKDAREQSIRYQWYGCDTGDTVIFGTFEQNAVNEDGPEEIQWDVLARENNHVLLISKYVLDVRPWGGTNWKHCGLRSWLNGTFLDTAFPKEERVRIKTTTNWTPNGDPYGNSEGDYTEDAIFLLSMEEFISYQTSAADTIYAEKLREEYSSRYHEEGAWGWWLRSFDSQPLYATQDGVEGSCAATVPNGVRPAMWVNVSEDNVTTIDLTDGKPVGDPIFGKYGVYGSGLSVYDYSYQPLDNDHSRYVLEFTAPEGLAITLRSNFDPSFRKDGPTTTGKKQTLIFDWPDEDIKITASINCNFTGTSDGKNKGLVTLETS